MHLHCFQAAHSPLHPTFSTPPSGRANDFTPVPTFAIASRLFLDQCKQYLRTKTRRIIPQVPKLVELKKSSPSVGVVPMVVQVQNYSIWHPDLPSSRPEVLTTK